MTPKRLPRHLYQGERTCAFTACTRERVKIFVTESVVHTCVEYLNIAAQSSKCIVPVYCFMPDHLHVMFKGLGEGADMLAAMTQFKRLSGLWMYRQKLPGWQVSFYDHNLRQHEDWRNHVRYIAENPERAGLVDHALAYPFTGSIGCLLAEILMPWESQNL